jgi:hypothetical protein
MPPWNHPPFVKGATSKEQSIINEAFHLAEVMPDRRHVGPIRDAVDLIVDLIENRGKRQRFDEHCDRPHEES